MLQFDAMVCDFSMPGMNGLALLRLLRARGCSARFILYSAKEKDEEIAKALTRGLDVYLQRKGNPESEFRRLKQFIRAANRREKPGSSLP
jgi:DNA-binding NarL/FixJ family response regulator